MVLKDIDLSLQLSKSRYEQELAAEQLRLLCVQQRLRTAGISVIIMYEGWDAAGKGGSIRRITEKLDPRNVRVWPVGAPDPVEARYHYLWRFWTRMPAHGQIAIFDRSWYGRVLVERVEKLTPKKVWQRAYQEIRHFEKTLVDDDAVLIKFWLHISKDEQLRRFEERQHDPFKQWKISDDDWRNREKWNAYEEAAEEMLRETDVPDAPWSLIAAEDKYYARVATVRIAADRLEQALAGN